MWAAPRVVDKLNTHAMEHALAVVARTMLGVEHRWVNSLEEWVGDRFTWLGWVGLRRRCAAATVANWARNRPRMG